MDPRVDRLTAACTACGSPAAFYYSRPEQHMGLEGPFKSVEERDAACAKGEAAIRQLADMTPIPELSAALDEFFVYLEEANASLFCVVRLCVFAVTGLDLHFLPGGKKIMVSASPGRS